MQPLIKRCQLVILSLAFDGLTVYTCYHEYFLSASKKLKHEINSSTEESVENAMDTTSDMPELDYIVNPIDVFSEDGTMPPDGNHDFYHRDGLDQNVEHLHFKFKRCIDVILLDKVLNILVKNNLLSPEEKQSFILMFTERFIGMRQHLDSLFDSGLTAQKLINFIGKITENELLADLHTYLLNPKFDSLRKIKTITTFWQGTAADGRITATSQDWAMIEKSIALQMSKNIKVNSHFDARVAAKRALELGNNFPFFAIKRRTSQEPFSKSYIAFADCDETFEQIYSKHFKKYT